MAVQRYVLISTDPADKVIKGGPILWNGVTPLTLPSDRHTITESAAIAGGYAFPPIPITEINAATLKDRAAHAIIANITYLSITSPTNAQVVAQVNRLTKECSGLIRLLLDQTDDIAGT